jgi:hypothetical protein
MPTTRRAVLALLAALPVARLPSAPPPPTFWRAFREGELRTYASREAIPPVDASASWWDTVMEPIVTEFERGV